MPSSLRLSLRPLLIGALLSLAAAAAHARAQPDVSGLPRSFSQCASFFADRRPPAVPPRQRLRELCYKGFAVLHSGDTRTPLYVAQRLSRDSVGGIKRQKSDRFLPMPACRVGSAPSWRTTNAPATRAAIWRPRAI